MSETNPSPSPGGGEVERRSAGAAPAEGPEEPRRAGAEVGRRVACTFVLLSVVAAFAPVRRYVARLDRDEFILWTAAVAWTMTLPIALVATLRLAQRWMARRGRKGAGAKGRP